MYANCIYNPSKTFFAMLTKAKCSLIVFIYLNILEFFHLFLLPLTNSNDIVCLNIKEIQLFYIKSKLFLHHNKFKIPGIASLRQLRLTL